MRTEEAFKMLIEKIEHLAVDASAARAERQRRHDDVQRMASMNHQLSVSLSAHRKMLKAKKVPESKMPRVPYDWKPVDEDVPF